MSEKKECAVLGCVVRPKGAETACAAHRATYALQCEIMRRQQLEQEVEQLIDLLLNFSDRQEQLELVQTGFPEQYDAWEALNADVTQAILPEEQEPPCCSATGPTLPPPHLPARSSETPSGFPPPPARSVPTPENSRQGRERPAPARRRLPPPPPPAGSRVSSDTRRPKHEQGSAPTERDRKLNGAQRSASPKPDSAAGRGTAQAMGGGK